MRLPSLKESREPPSSFYKNTLTGQNWKTNESYICGIDARADDDGTEGSVAGMERKGQRRIRN